MLRLAVLAALAYADEELRLRVSIPTIDEATMHERAFAAVDATGDVREGALVHRRLVDARDRDAEAQLLVRVCERCEHR